ncbi:MAG: NUDIX hydrolase [Clostridiales bacterium]|nr:NUDIX hydrolase [Clostridiales bacterium]
MLYYRKNDNMQTIEIIGENYFGRWDKTRVACRGIVINDGQILMSYASKEDVWMIPGGGQEAGETYEDCCVREVGEETGLLVIPSAPALEIDEYYEDCKYLSVYFFCKVIGETPARLTEAEINAGLEKRWIDVKDAISIFSRHAEYAETDEMKRGLYLREYTALKALTEN